MTDGRPELGAARVVGLLIATALVVGLLGRFDICDIATRAVTGDGERTRMQPTRIDPTECDPRFGEALLETQRALEPPARGRKRVVFFGNSQQFTASLPRGATPDESNPAEMASAIFAQLLEREAPERFAVYTASAPNQTFPEALWQAIYWFDVRTDRPEFVVLQASFDTFRKPGIRVGFRTLLEEPAFDEALTRFELEHPGRAWSEEFAQARKPREDLDPDAHSQRPARETAIREQLEHLPLFAKREMLKQSFLLALYSARVLVLGISPTTKRHIVGRTFDANMSAFEDLVRLSRARGARVLIYNAPTNPSVSMFYEDEYADYIRRVSSFAGDGVFFADLGGAVSNTNWGYWIDGPDPIHFDRAGHAELAEGLFRSFRDALLED